MQKRKVTVESVGVNANNYPLVRCFVEGITPPNAKYSIPLNLTPEQGETLNYPEQTEYEAVLVQGKLKNNKDGAYPDHYYYDVAMFEGVVNESHMSKARSEGTPQISESSPGTAVEIPPAVHKIDDRGLVYQRQTGINAGAAIIAAQIKIESELSKTTSTDDEIFDRTVRLSNRLVGYLTTGNADGLVDVAVQAGAEITDVVDSLFEEIVYTYPEPPQRVTEETFRKYTENAGWSWEDVEGWLDGLDPVDWVTQEKGRSLRLALRDCRDKAIELELEPPQDFRIPAEAKE